MTPWMAFINTMLNEQVTEGQNSIQVHLYEVSKTVKLIEARSRLLGTGGGNGELLINGYKISVMQDE